MITEATSGAVGGRVLPLEAASTVSVITPTDTLSAYADAEKGNFLIRGVPSGTFSVKLYSKATTHRDTTLTGVQVTIGGVCNVGTITLPAN